MNNEITYPKNPKRVLITGCSSGFGLLTAVGTATLGFETIATMRNPDKSGPLQEALKAANVTAQIEKLDITNPESIPEFAEKIGPVDILINNAGILITGSFLDQTDEELRRIFETNYFGAVNLTRAFTPAMIERGHGRIINIASMAGLVGHPFNAAYAASKHALIGFTQSIRVELAPFGIDAVSIEPGYHKTEIIGVNAYQSDNFYDRSSLMFEWNRGFLRTMLDMIIPNAGDPQDVANLILKVMTLEKTKLHYIIGKDARFATTLQWLGLGSFLERKVIKRIRKYWYAENKREAAKKARRKQKRGAEATR